MVAPGGFNGPIPGELRNDEIATFSGAYRTVARFGTWTVSLLAVRGRPSVVLHMTIHAGILIFVIGKPGMISPASSFSSLSSPASSSASKSGKSRRVSRLDSSRKRFRRNIGVGSARCRAAGAGGDQAEAAQIADQVAADFFAKGRG